MSFKLCIFFNFSVKYVTALCLKTIAAGVSKFNLHYNDKAN